MGMLRYLRDAGVPWLGSTLARVTGAGKVASEERLATTLGAVTGRVKWLPYLDTDTGETAAVRAAYRKMLRDPTVKAGFWSKICGVASLDLQVHPDGTGPKAKQVADFVRWTCEHSRGGSASIVQNIAIGGCLEGFSVGEKVMDPIERGEWAGKWGVREIAPKDPNFFRLETDQFRNITRIISLGSGPEQSYPVDAFVIWQHMPLYKTAIGTSDFRAAYRAYWLMDTAWKMRGIHLEKYTSPLLLGKYTDKTNKQQLAARLEAAKSSTWIMAPMDATVEALQLSQRGTADFQAAILDLRAEIMLGITGAFLQAIEGVKTGARSIGEVHQSSADLLVWYLASQIAEAINRQLIPDLVDMNFVGSGYPLIQLGGIDPDALLSQAKLCDILLQSGLPLSKAAGYKTFRQAEPTGPDDFWRAPVQGGFSMGSFTPQANGTPAGGLNGMADRAAPEVAADPFRGRRFTERWADYVNGFAAGL